MPNILRKRNQTASMKVEVEEPPIMEASPNDIMVPDDPSNAGGMSLGSLVNLYLVNSVPGSDVVIPPGTILIQQVPVQPPPPPRTPIVGPKIIGHCIFCLRQLVEATRPAQNTRKNPNYDEELQIVQKADIPPSKVSTFNMLLPHLHRKWMQKENIQNANGSSSTNPSTKIFVDNRKLIKGSPGENSSLPKEFPHLPAMCRFCGNNFIALDKIIQEMKARIEELRIIINDSKHSGKYAWRWEQFEKDLKSNPSVTRQSIKKTFEFYEGFGVDDGDVEDLFDEGPQLNPDKVTVNLNVEPEEVEVKMETHQDFIDESIEEDMISPSSLQDPLACNPVMSPDIPPDVWTTFETPAEKTTPGPPPPGPQPSKIKCEFCPVTVPTSEHREHLQQHISDYVVTCPNPSCDRAFSNSFKLRKHLRMAYSCQQIAYPSCHCRKLRNGGFHCKCKYSEMKCEVCDFRTSYGRLLRIHLNKKHENPMQRNFFCPISGCGKGFTHRQSVHCHLYGTSHKHDALLPSQEKCAECGILIDINEMTKHLQNIHQTKEIACKQCQLLFPSWETLLEHLFSHRKNPEAFTCYLCNDGIQHGFHKSLQYHFYSKHKIGKVFRCGQCRNIFFNEGKLEKHRKSVHANSLSSSNTSSSRNSITGSGRLYVCSVAGCGRIFNQGCKLRLHKNMKHNGGLPCAFKCDMEGCGKSFQTLSKLEEHKEVVHLGMVKMGEVMCEVCGEYFSDEAVLNTHQSTHSEAY